MNLIAVTVGRKAFKSIAAAARYLEVDYDVVYQAVKKGYGIKGHKVRLKAEVDAARAERQAERAAAPPPPPQKMLLVYPRGERPLERGLRHWR